MSAQDSLQNKESFETSDLLADMPIDSREKLEHFLEQLRKGIYQIIEVEQGQKGERCGITSTLVRRALLAKKSVVAITDLHIKQLIIPDRDQDDLTTNQTGIDLSNRSSSILRREN